MTNNSTTIARQITKFTPQEIRLLFKTAKTVIAHDGVTIKAAKKTNPEIARILIIIPRHVGNAVERNLLRRQIKNIFYQEKLFEHPYDLVIILKKGATDYSFDQLRIFLLQSTNCG